MTYKNLYVFIIPPERRTNHYMCKPYRFQVTQNGTNINAFTTWRGFKRWLSDHNLKLGARGEYRNGRKIIGAYINRYVDELPHADLYSMTLSNGEYVNCAFVYGKNETVKYVKQGNQLKRQPIEDYWHYEAIFC